jgi:hypothetical protein
MGLELRRRGHLQWRNFPPEFHENLPSGSNDIGGRQTGEQSDWSSHKPHFHFQKWKEDHQSVSLPVHSAVSLKLTALMMVAVSIPETRTDFYEITLHNISKGRISILVNMTVLWDIAMCSLAEVDRCFEGVCCLHHQGAHCSQSTPCHETKKIGWLISWDAEPIVSWRFIVLMMEAESTSETSVNFYETTRCNIPEDGLLHTRQRENLKAHRDNTVRLHTQTYEIRNTAYFCGKFVLHSW